MKTFDKLYFIKDIKKFLVEDLFIDISKNAINEKMSLSDDLGIDSIGFYELFYYLESKFNFKIQEDDRSPENFKNIACIVDYIESQLNAISS